VDVRLRRGRLAPGAYQLRLRYQRGGRTVTLVQRIHVR